MLGIWLAFLPVWVGAQGFKLDAPQAMVEEGFLQHLLPRFSLKTGVRIEVVQEGGAASIGAEGVPVFRKGEVIWSLAGEGDGIDRFRDWLLSDIGKRTIEAFADGAYTADLSVEVAAVAPSFDGDIAVGEKLSLTHCGRCHVVNETNRMNGMGSTPSFPLLRTFSDWDERFESFYVLKPHAAFTQIEGVTPPFDIERPSPIVPMEITLEDLEAITAYVAIIAPADLGAPIKSQ